LAFTAACATAAEERPPVDPLANAANPGPIPPYPPPPFPPPPDGKDPFFPRRLSKFDGPDSQKAREAFRNMTPEERKRWAERFRKWAELTPEQKREFQDRHEMMRRKIREEIEEAIKSSGLSLSEDQKKAFAERYMTERRKIEEELRRELEEKRRPRVEALVNQLKQEFAAKPSQP
jgi:hypothetical protein